MTNSKDTDSSLLAAMHESMGVKSQHASNIKPDKHTSKSFDEDLNTAIELFLRMGDMVVNQIAKAIHALTDVNSDLATDVMQLDAEVNQMERDIDEKIVQIVIKRQPTANDLRLVMAMSKGVLDLERIGDEANKIAKMALELAKAGAAPLGYAEVQHLSNQVRLMIHDGLEAFRQYDAEQAFAVIRSDSDINTDYQTAIRALMSHLMADASQVNKVINMMWVLRSLERIGDHAKNIAELVIYVISGSDVKHTDYEHVEQVIEQANQKAMNQQKPE